MAKHNDLTCILMLLVALFIPAINALPAPNHQKIPYLPARLIALEEHASFPSLPANTTFYQNAFRAFPQAINKLPDVGAGRLADMDAGHVSMQVLSQIPGIGSSNPQGCYEANDALHAAIQAHSDRFSGFAVLPMAFPLLAAAELERAVTQLGLVGAMIDNHLADGTYYDNETFWPVFATAERLDVPIYIHPAPPSAAQLSLLFEGNYPASTAFQLSAAGFGWHIDVALHLIRLYAAGLFTAYPNLKIIIGHDGEDLPMMINRVDDNHIRNDTTLKQVWERNIWVTTAGFFHLENFRQLLEVTDVGRVMFSVDYPLVGIEEGWEFVKSVAESGILGREEMDSFAWGNTVGLLGL